MAVLQHHPGSHSNRLGLVRGLRRVAASSKLTNTDAMARTGRIARRAGLGLAAATIGLGVGAAPTPARAQTSRAPVFRGTADKFAVLGGSTITNTGTTVITGDLGLDPGTAVVGFPPGTVNGAEHVDDAVTEQAQAELLVSGARDLPGCSGAGKRLGSSRASRGVARRALLCLLNETRRAHGLKRLRGNVRLRRAAERHSRSMVELRYFSHVNLGGLSPLDRIVRTGYLRGARKYIWGENLGYGRRASSSPRRMMRAWMNSTLHRANILTGGFREVGLGVASGIPGSARASGGTYTTVFGIRS